MLGLRRVAVSRKFLDVMDQAEELPLAVDFPTTAQRKAIEPFVVAEIAEHRFDGAKARAVPPPPVW